MRSLQKCLFAVLAVTAFFAAAPRAGAQVFDASRFANPQTATLNWLLNRPTVSPYTNLSRTDNASGGATNYQRMVRPALDARRNQQMQSMRSQLAQSPNQAQSVARRRGMQNAASTGPYGQYPSQPISTGHPTSYNYYSHFYDMTQEQRAQRPFR